MLAAHLYNFTNGNWFPNNTALTGITNFWIYGTDINGINLMDAISTATRIYIFNTLNNAYCLYNLLTKTIQSTVGYYCTVASVCGAGEDISLENNGNPLYPQSQPFTIYFNLLNTDLTSNILTLLQPATDNQVIAYSQSSSKFSNIYYTEGISYIFSTTINGTLMTSAYVSGGNITFVNANATPPATVTSTETVTDIFISQYDANGNEMYDSLALEFASNTGVIMPIVRLYNPTQRNKFFDFNVTMMLTSTVNGIFVIRLTVIPFTYIGTQSPINFINGEGLILCPVVIQRLIDLTDIVMSDLSDKDLLRYNVATSCWVNCKLSLSDLTNVNLSDLQTGDTLAYDVATASFNNMPNKLINLLDVNNYGFSDKKILMYDQSVQNYDVKAYSEVGFAYNLSTDITFSYPMVGRFKMINNGSPTTNPIGVTTLLISVYDINSNPVAYNLLRMNISPNTTLIIRDPTDNVNEIYFGVNGTATQDSNQFTVSVNLESVLGSFTAELMYIITIITPPNINSLIGINIDNPPNNGDVLTYSSASGNWQNQQPATYSTYRYQYTYKGTYTSPTYPTLTQGCLYIDTTNNMMYMNDTDTNASSHIVLFSKIGYGSIIEILLNVQYHQRYVLINVNANGDSYVEYKYDPSLSVLEADGSLTVGNIYDIEIHYQTIKNLDDLGDVDIATPLEDQLLTYDYNFRMD